MRTIRAQLRRNLKALRESIETRWEPFSRGEKGTSSCALCAISGDGCAGCLIAFVRQDVDTCCREYDDWAACISDDASVSSTPAKAAAQRMLVMLRKRERELAKILGEKPAT